MRHWIPVVLGTGFVLILVWFSSSQHPEPPTRVPTGSGSHDQWPGPAGLREPANGRRTRKIADPLEDAPVHEDRVLLEGTITVVDPFGRRYPDESGKIDLAAWSGTDTALLQEVRVRRGAWSVRVGREARILISGLELGGRVAYAEASELPFPPKGSTLDIKARWPDRSTLRVVSRDLGADLSGILVLEAVKGGRNRGEVDRTISDTVHPGTPDPDRVVMENGISPIQLPDDRGLEAYWVRAPGYAWGRVVVDHGRGGEHVLVLPRAGELRVSLRNLALSGITVLRVWATTKGGRSSKLYHETRPELDSLVVLSGMAPGSYEVRAEVGRAWSRPAVLASARVEILEDRTTDLTLDLENPPASLTQAPVALRGTLRVSPAWEARSFALHLTPTDRPMTKGNARKTIRSAQMTIVDQASGLFRWSAGEVLPGTYSAVVRPWNYTRFLHVPTSGLMDAAISLPEPVDVLVWVRDLVTGQPADVPTLFWSWMTPEHKGLGGTSVTKRDVEQPFRFRAPMGRINVSVSGAPSYQYRSETFDLNTAREYDLSLAKACNIKVILEDGDAVVRPGDLTIDATRLDGDGSVSSWDLDEDGILISVTAPGCYAVKVPPMEGYDPVLPQEAEVRTGETTELVIRLRPTAQPDREGRGPRQGRPRADPGGAP